MRLLFAVSLRNKIRIFNTNVKSVLLYGSETWRVNQDQHPQTANIYQQMPQDKTNPNWDRGWIGHTLRKPEMPK